MPDWAREIFGGRDAGSPARSDRPPRLPFAVFLTTIALVPLPLGTTRPLAVDGLSIIVGLLLIGCLTRWPPGLAVFAKDVRPPAFLMLAVMAVIVVQASTLTPGGWHNAVWDQGREALGQAVAGSVAVDRAAAWTGLQRLATYIGVFVLSLALCRDRARARTALRLLVLAGSAYALYGLIVYWAGNASLLWFRKWAYFEDLTGAFVNRNNFGAYLGLCGLAAIAQLVLTYETLQLSGGWRDKLIAWIEFTSARAWALAALFVVVSALVLTHSRGAFLSALAGMTGFALILTWGARRRRFGGGNWAALAGLLALGAVLISGEGTFLRLSEAGLDGEGRLEVQRLTWQAIGDHPWLGTGLGSFAAVFPQYRTAAVTQNFDLAHNDYLENMLELGVPGSLCLFAAIAWQIGLCLRGVRIRRRDIVFPCLGIAASVQVGLHALVDFSLQIPAVTATYLLLLGMAVAQSRSSREEPAAASPACVAQPPSRLPSVERR